MSRSTARLNLKSARLLVVDDNPRALEALCQAVLGFGVNHLSHMHSAEEAKSALMSREFDLVLLDGEMPELDGIELARFIRTDETGPNFTAPIILISAFTSRSRILRARDAGANMVIAKPIVPGVLLSRIEWAARNNREFVISDTYRGPDRRVKVGPPPPGVDERRADALAITATADRTLSQSDVDSLFG